MLRSQKKLTIAIPTYNRANYLDILLNSILIQYTNVSEHLELFVSDNASTDNTKEVVDKYLSLGLQIKYFCQRENLGPDRNIANCFIQSSGEYVWVMGDDDHFLPNAISVVLLQLIHDNEEIAIIHIGATTTKSLVPLDQPNINMKIVDKNTFVKKINVFLTFISGNIVNKNMFLKYETQDVIRTHFDTYMVQLSWIYKSIAVGDKFIICDTPLIVSTPDNTGGYSLFEIFATNQSKIATKELKDYPKLIKYIEKGTLLKFFPQWINLYLEGKMSSFIKDKDPFIILRSVYGKYFEFWAFIYPMKFLPKTLRRVFIKMIGLLNLVIRY